MNEHNWGTIHPPKNHTFDTSDITCTLSIICILSLFVRSRSSHPWYLSYQSITLMWQKRIIGNDSVFHSNNPSIKSSRSQDLITNSRVSYFWIYFYMIYCTQLLVSSLCGQLYMTFPKIVQIQLFSPKSRV